MAAFLDWIVRRNPVRTPQSSWVSGFGFALVDDGRTGLLVEFNNGFQAFFPFKGRRDYDRMVRARSKGKFVWKHLYFEQYEELSG